MSKSGQLKDMEQSDILTIDMAIEEINRFSSELEKLKEQTEKRINEIRGEANTLRNQLSSLDREMLQCQGKMIAYNQLSESGLKEASEQDMTVSSIQNCFKREARKTFAGVKDE